MARGNNNTPLAGWRPVPDPTVLTTEQLMRAVESLRETIQASSKILETRIDGMDKAIKLLQENTDRFPAHVQSAVERLQELHEVKFNSVQNQFVERDKRTEQLSLADKTAIAAALQAQKEAAGATNESNAIALLKMENNFTKLIDQLYTLQKTVAASSDDKIDDLKTRLTGMENRTQGIAVGAQVQKQEGKDAWGFVFGAAGMAFGAITLLVLLFKIVT